MTYFHLLFQAQSDDDDMGPDDVAVNVEGNVGYMDDFFNEVSTRHGDLNIYVKGSTQ